MKPLTHEWIAKAEGEVLVAIEVIGASEMGLTPERAEIILDPLTGVTAHST